ncbi:MAG: RNA methyltransferase [Bacterioplanes sp.]|nr:RNA methyltransferase [Bacterioplanes sp.]
MLADIRIVMVNTTHSGNIGAAARAMKNMGLAQLTLVDPIACIDDEAIQRASRADEILHNAVIVDTLEEAIADCHWVVGTSARSRHIPWPLLTPRQCAAKAAAIAPQGNRIAVVFGRESRGLTNEELHLCHAHVHIPTDENFSSLNVAQAIQLISYEMRLAALALATPGDDATGTMDQPWGVEWDHPLASHGDVNGMMLHLEQTLLDIGFLDPNTPKQLMSRLRRLFQRAALDTTEVNILRGILATVQRQHTQGVVSDSTQAPNGDEQHDQTTA